MSDSLPAWRIYERLVAHLESAKSSDHITVAANVELVGAITGIKRQIDVLIDARVAEDISRRVIVDAKLHKRRIDVKQVEAFEGMMKDVRAQHGIIVCPNGYTKAALKRAQRSISITLLEAENIDEFDPIAWEPCLGSCAKGRKGKRKDGWVLYDRPLGLVVGNVIASIQRVGKCDECGDFHIHCWNCGECFAIVGEEEEAKCQCDQFWLTAREDEGFDALGNQLEAIVLIVVPFGIAPIPIVVDRRPLN